MVGVVLFAAGRTRPDAVESLYSRRWYPLIADTLGQAGSSWGRWTGAGDLSARHLSASEVLILVLTAALLWRLVAAARRGFGPLLRLGVQVAGSAYACFVLVWGLNHARLPLADSLGLEPQPIGDMQLYALALEIHGELVELLDDEEANAAAASFDRSRAGTEAIALWREAIAREPALGQRRALNVVSPAASRLLVSGRIAGIFSPFTQEAHVAFGMEQDDLLFTACHELAHAEGWAREDEANYLAWRVASRSGRPAFVRAARLLALKQLHRAAARESKSLGLVLAISFDPRVTELLGQRASFWQRSSSPAVSRVTSEVNDTYLKSQGQAEGVASYGRMVDLLVAEWLDAAEDRR